jgi:hypothetical protein
VTKVEDHIVVRNDVKPLPIVAAITIAAAVGLFAMFMVILATYSRSADTQAANQPDHDGNDQYQAKNAAKAGPAIPAVTIVATASEQQNQHEDNQNCTHVTPYLEVSVYP